jgi:exodeoxyribonuclease VII small subunit
VPKPSQNPSPTPPDPNADVAALGYEEARDELVAVVARLEAGAATLEESLALWERGEALATRCQEWLDGARERLSAVRDTAVRNGSSDDEESR